VADFGTDWSCELDLDQFGRVVSGLDVVRQAAIRRLTSRLGSLLGDPLYGYDLQSALSDSGTPENLVAGIMVQIRQQLLRDERIELVRRDDSSFDLQSKTLTLAISATTALGPFQLIFSLSPAGINLITA
jgi:phage baseplate assembly protein W